MALDCITYKSSLSMSPKRSLTTKTAIKTGLLHDETVQNALEKLSFL